MATNRQERELMRQRGAGTRQIKDLEFQLVLPGQVIVPKEPLSPPKSGKSRRTPQTREKRGPRSSTRKPVAARKKGAGKPSSSDILISENQEGVRGTIPTESGRGGKAAKKSKTGAKMTDDVIDTNGPGLVMDEGPVTVHEEQGGLPQANEEISHPILQANGKKRKKGKSIEQNSSKKPRLENSDGDREDSEQRLEDAPRPVNHQQVASADQYRQVKEQSQSSAEILAIGLESLPQNSAQDLDTEEVQNLTLDSKKSPTEQRPRRKKRKSIGQQKSRKMGREVATAGDSIHSARSEAAEAAPEDQDKSSTVKKPRGRGRPKKILSAIDVGDVQHEVPQATNSAGVVQNTHSAGDNDRPEKIPSSTEVLPQDEVRTNIPNSSITQNARTARGRGRPRKGVTADAVIQRGEGENENGGKDDHRPVEKPPTRKRGRPKLNVPPEAFEASKKRRILKKDARSLKVIDGKIPSASRQPPKNSMPVTGAHMFVNDALDFEHDHPESHPNSSALPKNDNLNIVDAVAEVCQELVSKSTESLDEAAKNERDNLKKATLERRRKKIEAYGEELDNRLFQLIATLDNNLALSACVRRPDKEENTLQAELKLLQEERESRDEANTKSQDHAKLTALLREIEAAVRHGKEMDHLQHAEGVEQESGNEVIQSRGIENLDDIPTHVDKDVNSASEAKGEVESGGLLDPVKSVNPLSSEKVIATTE